MAFSDEDYEDSKIEHERRKNPPMFDAGMGFDDAFGDSSGGDLFGNSSGTDPFASNDPFGGGGDPFASNDPFNSTGDPFGGGSTGGGFGDSFGSTGGFGDNGGFGGFGASPNNAFGASPTASDKRTEEKIFDAGVTASKETLTFVKLAVLSYKKHTRLQWVTTYKYMMFGGAGLSVVSILLMLFGGKSWDLLIGGLTSIGIGVSGFMYNVDKAEKEDAQGIDIGTGHRPKADEPTNEQQLQSNDMFESSGLGNNPINDPFGGDDLFGNMTQKDPFSGMDTDFLNDPIITPTKPKEEPIHEDLDGFDLDFTPPSNEPEPELTQKERMATLLDNINDNKKMTRTYLFETFSSVLENKNKGYADVITYTDDDKEFHDWAITLKKSAEILSPRNTDSEDYPYLISVEDRLFYTYLVISRVKWLKDVDKLVDEIVNAVSFDTKRGEKSTSFYGKGAAVGDKIYIKIMESKMVMITLKDIYDNIGKKIKSSKMKMPVVLGVTEDGEEVLEDFYGINSILVSGTPRTGKSYFTKSIIMQMCAFNSPKEIEFYIYDSKGDSSDFVSMDMPHIRTFESQESRILQSLQNLIDVEEKKRAALFKKSGVINIGEYNKKNPNNKMTYIYVIIDEVVSLVDDMDKETKVYFQGLLSQLITRLPNAGVRLFMIPHQVRDDIIKKRTTENIPCRISVMGSREHIESVTGATPREFPYKLLNKGDIAVKLTNDVPRYVKGNVIADSDDGYNIVNEFIRDMWLKLEPDTLEGSYYQKKLQNQSINTAYDGYTSNIEKQQPKKVRNIEVVPPKGEIGKNKKDTKVLSKEDQDSLLDNLWENL